MRWHPDKNADNPKLAEEKFVELTRAYDVLINKETRNVYNRGGEAGLKKYEK